MSRHGAPADVQRRVGKADPDLPTVAEHLLASECDKIHARAGSGADTRIGACGPPPVVSGESAFQQTGQSIRELLGEFLGQPRRGQQAYAQLLPSFGGY